MSHSGQDNTLQGLPAEPLGSPALPSSQDGRAASVWGSLPRRNLSLWAQCSIQTGPKGHRIRDTCQETEVGLGDDLRAVGLYSRVGLKVSIVDGFDQLFCDLNDLLFSHCWEEKSTNLPARQRP